VSATLKPIAESQAFRPDLYARIAAFVYAIPPLRERQGDLGLLVADLLPRVAPERASSIQLAPDLVVALAMHRWPMNIRELGHVLALACVTATENVLRLSDVGAALAPPVTPGPEPDAEEQARAARPHPSGRTTPRALSEEDLRVRAELVDALTRTSGNVGEVARTMGKTRMQIYRWMTRFAIDPDSFRS
jgi:DNA-binding NtrC family response regulator